MEHRLCKRTNVIVDVAIYCCDQVAARGKIRNLSRDGMFIETTALIPPAHIYVEVEFVAYKNGIADEQRVRAYVIHSSNEGIGLMSAMLSNDQLLSINRLSYEQSRCEVNMEAASIS